MIPVMIADIHGITPEDLINDSIRDTDIIELAQEQEENFFLDGYRINMKYSSLYRFATSIRKTKESFEKRD